jgi:hypothetical protein
MSKASLAPTSNRLSPLVRPFQSQWPFSLRCGFQEGKVFILETEKYGEECL